MMLPTINTDNRISAANDAVIAANDENILSILNESSSFLEEIKTIVMDDQTTDLLSLNQKTLDEIKEILDGQLELEKTANELQRIQIENEENARIEEMLERERAQRRLLAREERQIRSGGGEQGGSSFLNMLGLGAGAGVAGAGIMAALRTGLSAGLKNAAKGGGVLALASVFGDEIGSFLGENVRDALIELGADAEFAQTIDDYLTSETKDTVAAAGLSKIILGKFRYGLIAKLLVDYLGIPDLRNEDVQKEISDNIEREFGIELAKKFDTGVDIATRSGEGALNSVIVARLLGFGAAGTIAAAVAGALFDYYDMERLFDPDLRDQVYQDIGDDFKELVIGATTAAAGYSGSRQGRRIATDIAARANPVARANVLTPAQLTAAGLRRDGTGDGSKIKVAATNQYASQAAIDKALELEAGKRFPRLAKLFNALNKVPYINSVVAIGSISFIAMSDQGPDQKAEQIAGVLGGFSGSVLGGIAGAIMLSVPFVLSGVGAPAAPVAGAVGGVAGAIAGAVAGGYIARMLARYVIELDDLPTAETVPYAQAADNAIAVMQDLTDIYVQGMGFNPTAGQSAQQNGAPNVRPPSDGRPDAPTGRRRSLDRRTAEPTSTILDIPTGNDLLQRGLQLEGINDPFFNELAKSVFHQETSGGTNVRESAAGAIGPMQILPGTFDEVADPGMDINNPLDNMRAGIRYLLRGYNVAKGDPLGAAAFYYGGGGGLRSLSDPDSDPKPASGGPTVSEYANEVVNRIPPQHRMRPQASQNIQQSQVGPLAGNYGIAEPSIGPNNVSSVARDLNAKSQLTFIQPVNNITNVTNNNSTSTSVAGRSTNVGAGRTYNIDRSLTNIIRNREYA